MLDRDALALAFPFFVAMETGGRRLVDVGPSVLARAPHVAVGARADDVLRLLRPRGAGWERCGRHPRELWWVGLTDRLALRGQWVSMGTTCVFLGAPVVQALADIESLGLSMTDFAPHDGTVDGLFLLQARDAALADARELSERLQEQHDALVASRQAVADALRVSAEKSAFLAGMSHELRTPLNAIIGYTELLLEGDGREGAHPLVARHSAAAPPGELRRILHAADTLLSLINDVLDIAKIEAGRMDLQPRRARVDELLQSVQVVVRPLAERGGTRLSLSARPEGAEGWIDAPRLRQVLTNLVVNAIRAAPGGEVRVEVHGDEASWRFEVVDDGIGMDAATVARLFQPFVQGVGGAAHRSGGTGLGLTISRLLVRRMGGEIQVRSTPGEGSTFVVRVPHDMRSLAVEQG